MQASIIIIKIIIQLFLMILMGYGIVKCGLLDEKDSGVLSKLIVYVIMPCVIIHSFQIENTEQTRLGLVFAFVAAGIIHLLFLVLDMIAKDLFKLDIIERTSAIYPTATVLTVPLVEAMLGEEYVIYSCAFLVIQLLLLWTHGNSLISGQKNLQWKKIFFNVNIIAIAIGSFLFLTNIKFPEVIDGTMSKMSAMVGPMGMLNEGMLFAGTSKKTLFGNKRNYLAVVLRLVVYPLTCILGMYIIQRICFAPDSKNILLVVFMAVSAPTCTALISMAQIYDREPERAGALFVLSHLAAMVTIPLMIQVFINFV